MRHSYERCAALVLSLGLVLALLLAGAFPANAQSYEEALAKFAADSYSDTDAAVAGIAASGKPASGAGDRGAAGWPPPVQRRRQEGLHPEAAGRPASMRQTGWPVSGASPAGLNPVRVNNRVRRAIDAALGSLTLLSADPVKRLEAAKAVFKSKDANVLATLDTAISKESRHPREEGAGGSARGDLGRQAGCEGGRQAGRHRAPCAIAADQDARSVLAGVPGDQSANIQKALADAIVTIDNRLAVWNVAQNLWYGNLAGLGAAARRYRACHHLRRHGRHQTWRTARW